MGTSAALMSPCPFSALSPVSLPQRRQGRPLGLLQVQLLPGEMLQGQDGGPFYGAPAVLVVLAKKDFPTYIYDGSLVMGELMHAAHAVGLATCWIHRAKETFELPEGQELLRSLGITDEYEGIGNCIIGYADGPLPEAKPRKENWIYPVE